MVEGCMFVTVLLHQVGRAERTAARASRTVDHQLPKRKASSNSRSEQELGTSPRRGKLSLIFKASLFKS